MSATAASLPCPICAHTGVFESVESLRDRLINVSTNKVPCPVCQEEVTGLDKLTIHLFSHVKILTTKPINEIKKCENDKSATKPENQITQQKKHKPTASKNKTSCSTAAAPMKYVKIYPKLPVVSLNTVPVLDISRASIGDCVQSVSVATTVKTEAPLIQTNTTCSVCGLQFVDADILRMHRCLIHNIDENTYQNFTRYQCHLCPKNFKMKGSLMVHLRVAHFGFLSGNSNTLENRNEEQSSEQINDDKTLIIERSDNKQWQCDVCRKCFTTKYFLKKHKRLHTGETPYACTQCSKTFTFQQSYHKHLLYHNDEKPHTCQYCGRAFKELSTLHNHQRIHTGEKPFSCETCGKCFRQRVSYLVHRRIHTGVMPYKCTACEKNFRYKVSQRTHKCPSKPPGTVVRQSGDLVEKLKKKHVHTEPSFKTEHTNVMNTVYPEVSKANAELALTGAKLSLEDVVAENFSLITESCDNFDNKDNNKNDICPLQEMNHSLNETTKMDIIDSNLNDLIDTIPIIDKNVPSPSEILRNLCLSKDDEYEISNTKQGNSKEFDLYKDFEGFI